LSDQAKIRPNLRFVNKIGRGAARGMEAENYLVCFPETIRYVLRKHTVWFKETYQMILSEHTGMFGWYIPVCFWGSKESSSPDAALWAVP